MYSTSGSQDDIKIKHVGAEKMLLAVHYLINAVSEGIPNGRRTTARPDASYLAPISTIGISKRQGIASVLSTRSKAPLA
jgi:hypothetical protein